MSIYDQTPTRFGASQSQLLGSLQTEVFEIFSTMVGMEVSSCATPCETGATFRNCVSAMICFSGSFLGAVCVHAPPWVAVDITSRMLGTDVAAVDVEVIDALGEIANMIAGSFKQHVVKNGYQMRLTPPRVIARNEHFRPPDPSPDLLALQLEAGTGRILVTVLLEEWD